MKGFRKRFLRKQKVKSHSSGQVLGTKIVPVAHTQLRAPRLPKK